MKKKRIKFHQQSMAIMLRLFVLVAFFGTTVLCEGNFKRVVDGESILIKSEDSGNYALAAPELRQFNWASADVNGKELSITTPDCQIIKKNVDDFGEDERKLFESITQKLTVSGTRSNSGISFGGASGGSLNIVQGGSQNVIRSASLSDINNFEFDHVSYHQFGAKHNGSSSDSLAKKGIKWLMVDCEMVTFIYADGRVQAKPSSCLNSADKQMLADLKVEVDEAKAKWEKEFNKQMDELRQSLDMEQKKLREQLDREQRQRDIKLQQLRERLDREQRQRDEKLRKSLGGLGR